MGADQMRLHVIVRIRLIVQYCSISVPVDVLQRIRVHFAFEAKLAVQKLKRLANLQLNHRQNLIE